MNQHGVHHNGIILQSQLDAKWWGWSHSIWHCTHHLAAYEQTGKTEESILVREWLVKSTVPNPQLSLPQTSFSFCFRGSFLGSTVVTRDDLMCIVKGHAEQACMLSKLTGISVSSDFCHVLKSNFYSCSCEGVWNVLCARVGSLVNPPWRSFYRDMKNLMVSSVKDVARFLVIYSVLGHTS